MAITLLPVIAWLPTTTAVHYSLRRGLKIALADIRADALSAVAKEVAAIAGDANVLLTLTDVSDIDAVTRLRDKVYEVWGEVSTPFDRVGSLGTGRFS